MKIKEEAELISTQPTGTPQSRRRQAKRAAKKADKNHVVKRNKKNGQSKPNKKTT